MANILDDDDSSVGTAGPEGGTISRGKPFDPALGWAESYHEKMEPRPIGGRRGSVDRHAADGDYHQITTKTGFLEWVKMFPFSPEGMQQAADAWEEAFYWVPPWHGVNRAVETADQAEARRQTEQRIG